MTPESFAHALEQLDPGSRALLDLSVHRGLEDQEIAELLGADPGYVSSSREAAITQLADDLGMHGDPQRVREALGEMPAEAWRPPELAADEELAGGGEQLAEAEPESPPTADRRPPAAKRRPRPILIVLLLVAAAAAIVALASSGGDSSTSAPKKATPAPAPKPAASKPSAPSQPKARSATLTSLSASPAARGSAKLSGRRLTLTVSGLPAAAGSYEIWLYNDEIDATPVTTFEAGTKTVTARLPESPARYRYLDVSAEPADGNPNHSGQSVLRTSLRTLRQP